MKLNLVVMFGGASVEHEVSIISANQVINALNPEKYNVIPVYISKNSEFYYANEYDNLDNFKDLDKAIAMGKPVIFQKNNNNVEMIVKKKGLFNKDESLNIDLFFPVVHGTNVEDGRLQGYLETIGATYVGCDTKAAAVGQDKVFMKGILKSNGINVVDATWVYDADYYADIDKTLEMIESVLRYPMIVKPANLGSSIGISKANDRDKLKMAIEEAFKYDPKVLIEHVIENLREVNCAVLGDYSQQQTSAIEEVFQTGEILSYQDKYQSEGGKSEGMASTKRVIPAQISPELIEKVEKMAIQGFKALNLNGNARIDFLIDKNTDEVYLNEVNTIPGSLAFYLWKEKGIEFEQLCEDLIKLAIKKQREASKHINSFDSNILKDYKGGSKGKLKA